MSEIQRQEYWERFMQDMCDPKKGLTTYCKLYKSEECPMTCYYSQQRQKKLLEEKINEIHEKARLN